MFGSQMNEKRSLNWRLNFAKFDLALVSNIEGVSEAGSERRCGKQHALVENKILIEKSGDRISSRDSSESLHKGTTRARQ